MAFIENKQDELIYMSSTLIPVRHAFTTRRGGVSKGEFDSLNVGGLHGDDPARVRENYRRVCALMGADINGCAVTKQVHGNVVRIVTQEDRHTYGVTTPYLADGLATNVAQLPLLCFSADCIPALLCDPENSVIAAVHCGWRGSVSDILDSAVKAMLSLGAETRNIRVALGPAIGRCCFETHDDVTLAVEKYLSGDTEGLFTPLGEGKFLVDLRSANARRLVQLGLSGENIDISEECTMCSHDKYWSHRYTNGHRGTQAAGIVLD